LRNPQVNGRGSATGVGPRTLGPEDLVAATGGDSQILYPMDPIQVLRQRFWIILLVTVVVVGLAAGSTYSQAPTYEASIKVLLTQGQGSATDNLATEVAGLQGIMETMSTAIATRPVAEGVVQELDLSMSPESLQAGIGAELIGESQFIEVSYEDSDSERARLIVNTIGEVFSQQVSEVSSGGSKINATVWEKAESSYLVGPNMMRNILLALMLGLMLGVCLAFLLDYLDDSWKSPEEVERVSGVPTLGVVPSFKIPKGKRREN